jgi:hypothetical protein
MEQTNRPVLINYVLIKKCRNEYVGNLMFLMIVRTGEMDVEQVKTRQSREEFDSFRAASKVVQ